MLDPTTTGRVLGGTLKTERHSLDRYNGTGPRRYGGEVQARHAWPVRVKGDSDGGHTGLWDAVILDHRGYVNGTTLWAEGERVWVTPLAGVSVSNGQEALGTLVEFGGPADDHRLILTVGAGGGSDWGYYELYDAQTVVEALDPNQVNADVQAYKLVKRKMVGSGRWEDDGAPFSEYSAFVAEPFEGFAGRFRVRLDSSNEPSGRGLLVQARPSPTEAGKWEFTPVVPEFSFWKVTARTARTGPPNNLTPPLYTVRLVELIRDNDSGTAGDQEEWREVSPTVELTGCIRTPMKLIDESRLSELRMPIEIGTVVQVRPSPTDRGRYEVYGGSVQKWTKKFVVAACAECADAVYPPQIRLKVAKETLAIFGYDLTVFRMPASTGEAGERDNVSGQFEPPNDVGVP